MRKHFRLILAGLFAFVFGATFAFLSTAHQDETEAASTSGFRAGNIISDAVMTDYNSMTVADIQAFLKSKNSCDQSADVKAVNAIRYENVNVTKHGITYNRRYYFNTTSGVTSGLYHVKDGKFVCLANETINGHSAAYHIWDAAQSFKINPKVLIVLLEKEQGLITDKWPYEVQYRAATGYGCPDSAACDSKYYGLEAQVGNAAYLFSKIVYENKWNNYPVGNNYISYYPSNLNPNCGGSTVKVENRATGALYTYTPYQPNKASLAAGYGLSSDGCGAYGNRNFYLYFTDWFGNPRDDSSINPLGVSQSLTADQVAIARKIVAVYNQLGGSSKFGQEKTGLEWNSKTGIYWVEYEKGFVVGNNAHGYYESTGKIRNVWKSKGFESSNLGFPTSNIETNKKTGIYWQYFEGGAIVGNDKYGYYESSGKIRKVWQNQNFESGALGFPTSGIKTTKSTGMIYQYYTGGAIVGNDAHGYFESRGKIREVWQKFGFEFGALGFPTSNIETNKKTGIYWQYFEGGAIVGNDAHGYFESRGKIREAWASQNFEFGKLGFPTSDIYSAGTNRQAQSYEHGTIYLDTKTNKTSTTYK
ncbi:hypothetical protein IJ103_03415 [Candidatus Saccharibacteria bacterium]|nr:hypothetical protein [Candidatus Saccharibacteria bacterium]MBQ9017258.1 hypothetical protein [Candidatus Saccharibacteria bacterium]